MLCSLTRLQEKQKSTTEEQIPKSKRPKVIVGEHSVNLSTQTSLQYCSVALMFIIRKVGEQYQLVGEAEIDGFMPGEAIEMMYCAELEAQYIDLV